MPREITLTRHFNFPQSLKASRISGSTKIAIIERELGGDYLTFYICFLENLKSEIL